MSFGKFSYYTCTCKCTGTHRATHDKRFPLTGFFPCSDAISNTMEIP